MSNTLTIIIAIISSGAFTTLISYLLNNANSKHSKKDAVIEGLQIVLRNIIQSEIKEHLEEGKISADEYKRITDAYLCYKTLGGNGWLEQIMHELDKLDKEV